MHLALLSSTLIAMGAVILYLSTIRHSRSSPSYTFNSQAAMSVNSGRTIVKSSIPCGISTVLPVGSESSECKICWRGFIEVLLSLISPRVLQRRSIFRTKMERVSEALQRSEEHTSELQSHSDLVCRLLLEKKKETSSWTPSAAKCY